jgi:thymidylate synthase
MKQYHNLGKSILKNGYATGDRTGTGTLAMPGYAYQCKLDVDEEGVIHNFPLLTTKFVSLKSIFEELIWKLRGDTNIKFLIEHKNHIWTEWPFKKWLEDTGKIKTIQMWKDSEKSDYSDEWKTEKKSFEEKILTDENFCKEWGGLGRTYGHQFRHFGEITASELTPEVQIILQQGGLLDPTYVVKKGEDQLMDGISLVLNNPENRRIIISLWNPSDVKKTLLPPCPCFYQFFANQEGYLHLNMYQRSCDTFLGVPYNTAQDVLFLCLMAHITGRKPGIFNHFFGDAHIYRNHIKQIKQQLVRVPKQLPSLKINKQTTNILDFEFSDLELIGYDPEKGIKGAVSI